MNGFESTDPTSNDPVTSKVVLDMARRELVTPFFEAERRDKDDRTEENNIAETAVSAMMNLSVDVCE